MLAPLQGAERSNPLTGGLRFAPTSGYSLATLRVAVRGHTPNNLFLPSDFCSNIASARPACSNQFAETTSSHEKTDSQYRGSVADCLYAAFAAHLFISYLRAGSAAPTSG